MTVEKLDIIVQASVEGAVKDFQKLFQIIKKQLLEIQKEFNKISIKDINANIDISQATKQIQKAKKQIQNAFAPEYISKINYEVHFGKNIKENKNQFGDLKEQNTDATSQNKLSGNKGKLGKALEDSKKLKDIFSKIPDVTKNITTNIKKMGTGIKSGIGHVLKYASSLFSLRNIYSILSSSAQSWLSSQNNGAQQLSANIEYMKYAMGSVFEPVIEYVVNMIYQLMKAIQSLVYAFSGVNIFAKATASSMNKTVGSANKVNKSLNGIHNEINNVSENDNSGESNAITPNMDLSQMDTQMSPFAQKLYDFFKPLVDSWNTYGNGVIEQIKIMAGQVIGLISSVWGSFENIITNGTIYFIFENILGIIGNIAEAFSNAWNYNNNGDAIIQNLANAFNNLLNAINNVVQSEKFQEFLNNCSDKFKTISEKIESIDWQPLMDALFTIGENIGTIALNILSGLIDIFKWLVENPIIAELLLAIAIAVGVVSTAISILSTVMFILEAGLLPIIGIIIAIIAVISLIVLAIMNWDTIMKALTDTWNWICEQAQIIWNAIADFFKNLWQGICDTVTNVWNGIKEFFINYFNTVKGIFETIWNGISTFITNIFNGIKNTISNVLNTISTIWSNIWNGLKNTVTNIFNGIWNAIKNVINWILNGIENMGNGVVNGINTVIRALNRLSFKMPDWLGGGQFGFNIPTLNTISLPRLAKGNVAYDQTLAIFGEYSGAKSNPEITTPQNIMRETFEDVLSNYEGEKSNNSGELKTLVVQFGSTKVALEMERLLQQARRQNGTAYVGI